MRARRNVRWLSWAAIGVVWPLLASAAMAEELIRLYPDHPVGSGELVEAERGLRTIRNVSDPTLEVFRPEPRRATATAVIIAPGGAFVRLGYDAEGVLVARWLAEKGVTAFVLKYRLTTTPEDPAAFASRLREVLRFANSNAAGEPPPMEDEAQAAEDGAAAVVLVKSRAKEWGVDPSKVGLLGFSAGGMLASHVATGAPASRPDFVGFIYAGVRDAVPIDSPPAFFAGAADDPLLPGASQRGFAVWRAAGRPAELHVYEKGGHGFGLTPTHGTADQWIDDFFNWMRMHGFGSQER